MIKDEISYYSKLVKGYDNLYRDEQLNKLKIIKKNLKVNGLILDIGAGTGYSKLFFDNIVLLDPTFDMIKKVNGFKVVGQAEFLPFKDNSFDAIIAVTSLHHTDIDKTIKEIKRIAKDNCSFAFSLLKSSSKTKKIKERLKKEFSLIGIQEKKDLIFVSR